MTALADAILEQVKDNVRRCMPVVADGLLEKAKRRAPVDTGDTKSTMGAFSDDLSATIQVFTKQGAIQNDRNSFFGGASPAKHDGWFTRASWEVWLTDELNRHL